MLVDIYWQLVEEYKACVVMWKKLWTWCSAFCDSITDGDDRQQPGHSNMSAADDGVCFHVPLYE
jgi:hypothetical protein